jgi:hypothetical protein
MTTQTRPISILAVTLATLALLGAVAAAGTATAQSDRPTVRVVGDTVTTDGTTTVGIVLTDAPDGLAGYYLDVTVENPSVARIEGASYPDRFGLTTDPAIGADGTTVTLEAADMEGRIDPGATDVTLATVRIRGVAAGETDISVDPMQFDDDDGSAFQPAAGPGVATVDGSGGAADADAGTASGADGNGAGTGGAAGDGATGGSAAAADTPAETSGFAPLSATLVVLAFAALTAVALLRRRR